MTSGCRAPRTCCLIARTCLYSAAAATWSPRAVKTTAPARRTRPLPRGPLDHYLHRAGEGVDRAGGSGGPELRGAHRGGERPAGPSDEGCAGLGSGGRVWWRMLLRVAATAARSSEHAPGQVGAFGCLCVCQAAGSAVVELWATGLGSDLSKELAVGVGPVALDCRVAPRCPPGPVARRSSLIMVLYTWSARRLFRHRAAAREVLPSQSWACSSGGRGCWACGSG